MRRLSLVLLVAALASGGGYYWYAHGKADGGGQEAKTAPRAASRAVPVVTGKVQMQALPEEIVTIGSVQPIAAIAIKARVDSVVETVAFTEGQEVKAGDTLFTLDSRALDAQLRQAQANLERDRANLEKAKGDVKRYAELVRTSAISRTQYDAAVAAADALEGTVKADLAAIEAAKVSLSFTRIAAPMDGRTGTVNAKVGTMVRAADTNPLVTLTQLRPINVSFNVPEKHLPAIRAAMAAGTLPLSASIAGGHGEKAEGKLSFVDSQVDQQTGTILVKGEFPNADTRLWPGQFVDTVLTLRVEPNALTVPDMAVQTGQKGRFVYVVKADDTVEVRQVEVERTHGGLSVVASGLKSGERVVVDGQSRLFPGAKVTERANGKPAAPAGGETAEGGRQQGSTAQDAAIRSAETPKQPAGGAT
ncbi:efflux RND transporter periplasmic adaptor subunit [Azospirillum picis]|uniref:Multidrug efflux system membrane fusion protein n=1 Tax=Azospirillum picis TaxID=488438 RepID=A0ABU0MFV7_9PROT|nr:efflux RND transporter periplasmic adaptor subunit [Azospirillum picis]MBP2298703.1 multidrug efflux system membrane fusion protein [Azospirillum picis]MDQ0532248.1 multidrug efflux system membrane fusion protein [Azospirillum picis]